MVCVKQRKTSPRLVKLRRQLLSKLHRIQNLKAEFEEKHKIDAAKDSIITIEAKMGIRDVLHLQL